MRKLIRTVSQTAKTLSNILFAVRGMFANFMERIKDYRKYKGRKQALISSAKEVDFEAEWYVAFHEADVLPFWQWVFTLFTQKTFGHVFAFAKTGPVVVFVEPRHTGVQIELKAAATAEDYAREYARIEGLTIVRVLHNPYSKLDCHHVMNFIPSCVTVIKTVLGLPAPCVTPYGYYKYLLQSGKGELVWDSEEGQNQKAHHKQSLIDKSAKSNV